MHLCRISETFTIGFSQAKVKLNSVEVKLGKKHDFDTDSRIILYGLIQAGRT